MCNKTNYKDVVKKRRREIQGNHIKIFGNIIEKVAETLNPYTGCGKLTSFFI
jgi:hypothetical protein